MKPISWDFLREQAARQPARMVLADGDDPRAQEAARRAVQLKIADPVLLRTTAVDKKADFTQALMQIPKFQKLTMAEAEERVKDPLIRGCLMLRDHQVEGFIGGATRTTADTLRAVFSVIGLAPKTSTFFGYFLIEARDGRFVILADCAVIPEPSPKQLSQIALGAADAYRSLTGEAPKVAFLSFSTHGSAEHPLIDRVRQAVVMARQKAPDVQIEGEWQADAALDAFSAKIKGVGNSPVAGLANVLVAPTLETGNIAYKLVQRLGACRAVGPVLYGTAQPAHDLSRGCSAEDILDLMALTSVQVQKSKLQEKLAHAR